MPRRTAPSLLAFALVACAVSACSAHPHYVSTRQPDAVLLSNAQSPAEVRAAVVRALGDRRFTTESEAPGRLVARLDKGSERLRIAVEYSGTQYVIRYLDSTGMKTQTTSDGDVLVESSFTSWTAKLKHAIDEELQRPAREAAEAARREREYELLLQAQRTMEAQANAQALQAQSAAEEPPPAIVVAPAPAPPPIVIQSQTTVRHSEQNLTCCINGALYKCPGQKAFRDCLSSGPSKCTYAGRC